MTLVDLAQLKRALAERDAERAENARLRLRIDALRAALTESTAAPTDEARP